MPQVSHGLEPPTWLAPIAEALDSVIAERKRLLACFSTPPQFGKSELCFHFLAKALQSVRLNLLYLAYSETFTRRQMRRARRVADSAGVEFTGHNRALLEWYLANGSSLFATGITGSVTGNPADGALVDDAVKDWAQAQSKSERDKIYEGFNANVMTRINPRGFCFVVGTRWHEDDLIGRLIQQGWLNFNLPAINDEGESLWPEGRPIEFLESQREQFGEYLFSALYQGRPRPRGGEVFKQPSWCDLESIPVVGRDGQGVDLAYTAKTSADYSCTLLMRERNGEYWIRDFQMKQVEPQDFVPIMRSQNEMGKGCPARWHCSGTEMGVVKLINSLGFTLQGVTAASDKFVRAQPVAAAWNAGKVHVPRDASWSSRFVDIVTSFTGVGDAIDDPVDSLSSAFSLLWSGAGSGQVSTVKRSRASKGLRGQM